MFVTVCPARLAQALLVQKALISGELAEDQVLICISLVLLDQEVVGRRHWIMLIVLDLFDDAVETIKRLKVRRRRHLKLNLVEDGNLVRPNDHPIELILLDLAVPGVGFDIFDLVALFGI